MKYYKIQLNYNASYIAEVAVDETQRPDADPEGLALDMAREMAEEADASEFMISNERESVILSKR